MTDYASCPPVKLGDMKRGPAGGRSNPNSNPNSNPSNAREWPNWWSQSGEAAGQP